MLRLVLMTAVICSCTTTTKLRTCFSPDEPCADRLAEFMKDAKSLDVAVFDINQEQLVHAIASKHLEKTAVRVIVDPRQAKGKYSGVPVLLKAGVDVCYGTQRGYMHDKFTIKDGREVETGSYNYTRHATEANQENQVYSDDPGLALAFRERFEAMWATARVIAKPPATDPSVPEI